MVWGAVERGAGPQGADAGGELREQLGVDAREGDDALDADAVLACGLEGAAEEDADDAREVAGGQVVEHQRGVFTAEFQAQRGQGFGGGRGDGVGDGPRADKGEVRDSGVRG